MAKDRRLIAWILLLKLVSVSLLLVAVTTHAKSRKPAAVEIKNSCEDLNSQSQNCEQLNQAGVEFQAALALQTYTALGTRLREVKKDCPQFEKATRCKASLGDKIAASKLKKSYYKVSAAAGLQHFGVELIDRISKPAPRAPASR